MDLQDTFMSMDEKKEELYGEDAESSVYLDYTSTPKHSQQQQPSK